MKYKIEKFPKHIFENATLTDVKNEGSKWILTFYKHPIEDNNKIIVSFNGHVKLNQNLDKKITNVIINNSISFAFLAMKLFAFEDADKYQQITFYSGWAETQCCVKDLIIEEINSDDDMIFRTRKMVMPADLNGAGTLFGGRALSVIDEESYVFSACQLEHNKLVTVHMSAVHFESPAYVGDIIEIGCKVVKFGKTSITVKCVVRNKTTKKNLCIVDEIVFVALDENGKPTPHNKTNEVKD